MLKRLNVPWLDPATLRAKAQGFLKTHHPAGTPPIPIEDIVEVKLRLDVVPVANLLAEFDMDGFTSGDLVTIYVDSRIYQRPNLETRYRFTLAHEMGHIVLHRHILEKVSLSSPEEWRDFVDGMPEEERSRFEWQAYEFAGLVLVPPEPLEGIARSTLESVLQSVREAREHGLGRDVYLGSAVDLWCRKVAPRFHVSPDVVEKRLRTDGLMESIP